MKTVMRIQGYGNSKISTEDVDRVERRETRF